MESSDGMNKLFVHMNIMDDVFSNDLLTVKSSLEFFVEQDEMGYKIEYSVDGEFVYAITTYHPIDVDIENVIEETSFKFYERNKAQAFEAAYRLLREKIEEKEKNEGPQETDASSSRAGVQI